MKKLVLIMVFVLLMALFIAFNYLLWDRESKINELDSLKSVNANSSAEINSQERDIKRLEGEINQYEADISKLEKEKEQLSQMNLQLENDKSAEAQKTRHKIDIINILKQNADVKLFEAPVRKWVDAVNEGKYEEAYRLEFDNASLQSPQVSLEEYTNTLKSNVKSMKIKELLLDKEAGKADGDVFMAVTLEVKLAENAKTEGARFTEGLNKMKFKLDLDTGSNEFVITEITK